MKTKLAAIAALAIVAIVGSLTYVSQSPEVVSKETVSINENIQPVLIVQPQGSELSVAKKRLLATGWEPDGFSIQARNTNVQPQGK